MGLATAYLSVIVLLPLAALIWHSAQDGRTGFWDAVTEPQSVAALKLTLVASAVVVLINAVMGTIVAWILVRDRFRDRASSTRSSTCRLRCRRSSPG